MDGFDLEESQKKLIAIQNCKSAADDLITKDPVGKELYRQLKAKGCSLQLECKSNCEDSAIRAFYMPLKNTITLCSDFLYNYDQIQQAATHELVHAVDFCKDPMTALKCENLTCSELRAASFAECAQKSGLNRVDCIKGTAIKATKFNCEDAEELVQKLYPKCGRQDIPTSF